MGSDTYNSAIVDPLKTTKLHDLHRQNGGRMVAFAGYDMPVQYSDGIIAEHLHCRSAAALFDVSHMGQVCLSLPGKSYEDLATQIETLIPGDIIGLLPGAMRYSVLLNNDGGIEDDCIFMRPPVGTPYTTDSLFVVFNASRKDADCSYVATVLPMLDIDRLEDLALLSLQGPLAASSLTAALDGVGLDDLFFMQAFGATIGGTQILVSRSGYTGEDGFEISMPGDLATEFCKSLLRQPKTQLAGLGARDSLRLEAGLCLYGQDIDATTSPIEAGLAWTVGKRRRAEANFPGAPRILSEFAEGPTRRRIGILPKSKSIPRAHMAIMNNDGLTVGEVTSGAFGPSIGGPIAMGYVDAAALDRSSELHIEGRRGPIAIDRVKMPFVQANTVSRPT